MLARAEYSQVFIICSIHLRWVFIACAQSALRSPSAPLWAEGARKTRLPSAALISAGFSRFARGASQVLWLHLCDSTVSQPCQGVSHPSGAGAKTCEKGAYRTSPSAI